MNEGLGQFKAEEPIDTPYQKARQVWDDRIGSSRQQAYTWRVIALVCLVMTGLMGVALAWRSMSAEVIPYIVEVDDRGEVRLVGTPQTQTWEPGEGTKRFFLREWIEGVRGISSDAQVVRSNLLRAYEGATSRAQKLLDEQVREENPFSLADTRTREVQISAMAMVSDQSWRVEWKEVTRDAQGQRISAEEMMGIFELKLKVPKTREELEENPLGIFVEHFSWSRVDGGSQ